MKRRPVIGMCMDARSDNVLSAIKGKFVAVALTLLSALSFAGLMSVVFASTALAGEIIGDCDGRVYDRPKGARTASVMAESQTVHFA